MKVFSTVDRQWKAECDGARWANCVVKRAVEERRHANGRVVRVGA